MTNWNWLDGEYDEEKYVAPYGTITLEEAREALAKSPRDIREKTKIKKMKTNDPTNPYRYGLVTPKSALE